MRIEKKELTYTYGDSEEEYIKVFYTMGTLSTYVEVGAEVDLRVKSIKDVIVNEPTIIGYCRVNSEVQLNNLEKQKKEIKDKYKYKKLYKDQFAGSAIDSPIFKEIINMLEKGDTLVVTKLDILARTTKECIEIIECLFKHGICVDVLNVGLLDNNTALGKFFLTTLLAVVELERNNKLTF